MNIGLVTDFYFPWIAGPSIFLRNLGHGLAARGHSVSLLAPSSTGRPGEEQDGPVRVTRVRTVPSPFGYGLRVAALPQREIDAWLRDTQPDVVHAHHPFPLSAAAVFRARRHGIPVAMTNHTIPECTLWGIRGAGPAYGAANAGFGAWMRFLLSRCDQVTTPTDTAATALRKMGYSKRVVPISNGVDTERFTPGSPSIELRARLGLDERPIVLYTGRLDAEKDMGTWLRAAREVLRSFPVQFVIGGQGTDRPRLEQLTSEMGISGSVRFIGYLADDEFPLVYRLASLYFITSPVELQSITTLEAIASGLPIVAVRAGALPELVRTDENGFCVTPGDAAEAAERICYLLSNASRRAAMGEQSRALALTHDLEQSILRYEQFLQSTAQMHHGTRPRERAITIRS